MCPQISGGRFCRVVARTGSTVFRAEMLVTKYVLSSSRHLVMPFDFHPFFLTRALCRSPVVEGSVECS